MNIPHRIHVGLAALAGAAALGASQVGMVSLLAYRYRANGNLDAEGYVIGHILLRGGHHYCLVCDALPEPSSQWPLTADYQVHVESFNDYPLGSKITFINLSAIPAPKVRNVAPSAVCPRVPSCALVCPRVPPAKDAE